MDRDQVRTIVRAVLVLMTRMSKRTRTQADDLMAGILQSNEERIVDAAMALLAHPSQPPSEEQVVEALKSVGITM